MPDFGDGSAREDYGTADPNAPSVANGQITPAQWAEYQSKRRRDALLGVLGLVGATTGLGMAGQALGGATAGAANSPSFGIGAANTGTWTYPGATAAGAAGAGAAGAGAAGAAGSGVANTIAGATGKGLGGALGGLSAQDLVALSAALAGTVGGAVSGRNQTDAGVNTMTTDPQLKELLALMQGRLKKSEPLHDSVLSMANGLLPTQYQRPNPLIGG